MTPPQTTADRPRKLERIARILDDRGTDRILLTQPENLAWLLDGARTGVPLGGPPVFSATVHRDGEIVVTALANEAERLATEEIGGARIRAVDWFGDLGSPDVLTDADVADDLRDARARLLPVERERYTALGRDMARAMTTVLREAHPETTERDLAAALAFAVIAAGAEPAVLLVAGSARGSVPHPLPTDAPIGRRALAVLTGRRHGLHASLSRWVSFGEAEPDAQRAVREVEADVFAVTRPGAALADILDGIRAGYARHGLGEDGWLRHHQGGPAGYAGRDPKVSPGVAGRVSAGQAFAWNPWAPGAKIEDTVIADADRIDVLTVDPAWPTVDVRGLARPIDLDLS
ncbi:M24 family metallopeptidase [Microbacterium sp.]|uniref:M24 family metallopeptidase n=1 Tax=Microbacterium sp. TaxID=51671 RepID=UPI0028115300|nr:M24 family metallopeptidase [Microbacterium sp.]